MYTIENIINTTITDEYKRQSILIINEGHERYIEKLCKTPHDFYLIEGIVDTQQWTFQDKPNNLHIQHQSYSDVKSIDLIITFNRAGLYEKAQEVSKSLHVPVVIVDMASSISKVPVPFFANTNITNSDIMIGRSGIVSVGCNPFITKSWLSNTTGFGTTIQLPYQEIDRSRAVNKILLDTILPEKYISSLPITVNDELFTIEPMEASAYLHLWQNITPLMIDCMASNIPVITFKSQEFNEIIEKEACILIDDINIVAQPGFLSEILRFDSITEIVDNAKKFTEEFTLDNFIDEWNSIFNYTQNHFYTRG